ncbi:MAG: endo-1,4-beta-xylanase [Planctomycetes bacterium]|nr:endo-1,4-beta-xylanase [Planctomycetota bacterium]
MGRGLHCALILTAGIAGCFRFTPGGSGTVSEPPPEATNPDAGTGNDDGRAQQKPATGVYFNDFTASVGSGWSATRRDSAPVGNRAYLGQFRNDTVTLRLAALPPHAQVTVAFDLYLIGSWDGNNKDSGPDVWSLTDGEGRSLIRTTFAYLPFVKQAYPNSYPFGSHPGRTGAIENNSLGYSYFDEDGNIQQWNSVYHLRASAAHSSDTLTLNFSAAGLEEEGSETWGLDNVSVLVSLPEGEWETALVIEAEDFATRAIGGAIPSGWNIWQTGRITDWIKVDPRCTNLRLTGVVKADPARGNWPIMGITVDQRFEAHTTTAQHDWTAHSFDIRVLPGVRQVGFCFTNDEPPEPGQDRNLYVDRLEIAVPKGTPRAAWPTRVPIPDYLAEPKVPVTDDDVTALARRNIETYRKGDFHVRVVDSAGRPVTGETVRFDMFRHHFLWGSAVRFDLGDPDTPLERTYRRELGEMFNFGTTENLLRWGHFEPRRFWAGPSYLEDALRWARETDPAASLVINEYEVVAVPYMADNFFVRMKDAMERGGPLDGVGIQLHSNLGEWYTPREMWRAFERMAQLGVELHLTEVSLGAEGTMVNGGPFHGRDWSDELQAQYYEQVMTIAFGHPEVSSVTFWGFTDRRHFQPGSGMLDLTLRPKEAGRVYRRLLEQDWSTDEAVVTDAQAVAALRGFYGWYRVVRGDEVAIVPLFPGASGDPERPLTVNLHPFGDTDGDNDRDELDLAKLGECFTDEGVGPVLPDCAMLDFDADQDIDCDDWGAFAATWTGTGAPDYPPCTMPLPVAQGAGSRYVTLTVPPGPHPVAIHVTSDEWLCVSKYVDPSGLLVDEPVYLMPDAWGTVNLADPFIVPDSTYRFQAEADGYRSRRATAITWMWGDANHDGKADEDDVVLVVDAFHGNYSDLPFQQVDLAGCVPNRGVDFDDLTAVYSAVAGDPYSAICPAPCNPEGGYWDSQVDDLPEEAPEAPQ